MPWINSGQNLENKTQVARHQYWNKAPAIRMSFVEVKTRKKIPCFAEMSSAPRSENSQRQNHQSTSTYTHTHKHTNRQVPQSQEEKNSLSSVIFVPIVWPRLLWSDTLTWGLSSVVPPGVCTGAAPHSPRVLWVCCKKMSPRCDKSFTYFVLEKVPSSTVLSFSPWRCRPLKVRSEKKSERKERRRGIFFGNEWRHDRCSSGVKRNDSKGTGKKRGGREAHWVSRCSDSRG